MNFIENYPKHSIRSMLSGNKNTRYRNNIIFTIGYDSFGQLQIGPLQLDKTVKPAESNLLCSKLALDICSIFRNYLLEKSSIPVYHKELTTPSTSTSSLGFWRHIQIRENTEGKYLINFRVHNLSSHHDFFYAERDILVNYLQLHSQYELVQINYQEIIGKKEPTSQDKIYSFYHKEHLYQTMLDKTFIIHPLCFFQVNYETATMIFQKVRELVVINPNNTLLDLCCGVGIYSILLADLFENVIGIDSNPCNILTANQIKDDFYSHYSIEYIADRVENQVDKIRKMSNLTAIINPTRSGIPLKMIEFLKENLDKFDQIIYVSCNPQTLNRDLKMLDFSENEICDVIPVNQFPQTDELEVIVNIILNGVYRS